MISKTLSGTFKPVVFKLGSEDPWGVEETNGLAMRKPMDLAISFPTNGWGSYIEKLLANHSCLLQECVRRKSDMGSLDTVHGGVQYSFQVHLPFTWAYHEVQEARPNQAGTAKGDQLLHFRLQIDP